MVMMDSTNGKILAQVPAGKGIDGTWYDPATRLVFSSAGDGKVTIAKEKTSEKLTIDGTGNKEPQYLSCATEVLGSG